MSVENFDPYFKWLGISPKDQPPTHYRLLGIDPFTDDHDVISNAADRQMMLIRTFQSGQHSQVSQRLLNEIAAARTCLLDSRTKQEYDRNLRAQMGTAAVVKESTVATRPPAPGEISGPMAVPMTPPNQTAAAQASSPPVLGASTPSAPTPGAPLPQFGTSPQLNHPHGLNAAPTKRKRDSSNTLFWIVGAGIGAVLLLIVLVVAGKFMSPGDEQANETNPGGTGAQTTGQSGGSQTGQGGGTTVETTNVGSTVQWRSVGKRDWTFDRDDVHATKEMQPGSWLISRTDQDNFVVTLEYVLERGGAGGVYVRVPSNATWPWNQGLEVHFSDDYGNLDVDHESTGAIWHRTPPTVNASRPSGQWNQVRVEVQGRDITVDINGRVVTRYRMEESMPRRGHIGLDGVSGGITYRKVRVTELE